MLRCGKKINLCAHDCKEVQWIAVAGERKVGQCLRMTGNLVRVYKQSEIYPQGTNKFPFGLPAGFPSNSHVGPTQAEKYNKIGKRQQNNAFCTSPHIQVKSLVMYENTVFSR